MSACPAGICDGRWCEHYVVVFDDDRKVVSGFVKAGGVALGAPVLSPDLNGDGPAPDNGARESGSASGNNAAQHFEGRPAEEEAK